MSRKVSRSFNLDKDVLDTLGQLAVDADVSVSEYLNMYLRVQLNLSTLEQYIKDNTESPTIITPTAPPPKVLETKQELNVPKKQKIETSDVDVDLSNVGETKDLMFKGRRVIQPFSK